MSTKRGRPPLPDDERCDASIKVSVPANVANKLHVFAIRHRTTSSELARRYFLRLLERAQAQSAEFSDPQKLNS